MLHSNTSLVTNPMYPEAPYTNAVDESNKYTQFTVSYSFLIIYWLCSVVY